VPSGGGFFGAVRGDIGSGRRGRLRGDDRDRRCPEERPGVRAEQIGIERPGAGSAISASAMAPNSFWEPHSAFVINCRGIVLDIDAIRHHSPCPHALFNATIRRPDLRTQQLANSRDVIRANFS